VVKFLQQKKAKKPKRREKMENKKVEVNFEKEAEKYKKGFDILMDYFDSIPDEEQIIVDEQLEELGL
jgi:soluble cytochrome b562